MFGTIKIKTLLVFLLITAGLTNTAFIKKIKTPETVFFDAADARKNDGYQKVLTAKQNVLQQAKWQYLLERIRKSPAEFMRNGETFDGPKAANHLLWKISRRGRIINTAEEFIDKIASDSFSSGSPYLVKIDDKGTYPLRDILKNELRRLDVYLSEDRKGIS